MFRASLLLIVSTLVVGPDVGVLCKAWCDPAAAAATECHHQAGSSSAALNGTDDCGKAAPHSAFVKEDASRAVPPSDPQPVMVPRQHRAASSTKACPVDDLGCTWSLAPRPLAIALRI